MAVAASDIKFYLAANHAEDDTSSQGGAQDANGRVLDDQFAATAVVEFVSDNAGDTQSVTVTGRAASGAIVSEAETMSGTTPVATTQTFERILKVVLGSNAVGTILVKQGASGTTRHTFNPGEDLARALFYGAAAEASGGSNAVRYEKIFVENTHATDAALSVTIELTTDPRADYDIDLEDALDDNNSSANRLTEPAGAGMQGSPTWADGPKTVVGTDLAADEAQGVWIRQTLDPGTSPTVDEPVLTVDFNTA
jgi:hypothetical protein